jgi:tetratricopeptide (TPR) repeat protein
LNVTTNRCEDYTSQADIAEARLSHPSHSDGTVDYDSTRVYTFPMRTSPALIPLIFLLMLSGHVWSQTTAAEYLERGNSLKTAGQTAAAEEAYSQAINIDRNSASAYLERGDLLMKAGRHEAAIADFTSAIALDPTLYRAYAGRAFSYGALSKFAEAIPDATRAIEIDPSKPDGYSIRGRAHYALLDAAAALPDLNQAIDLGLKTASAYHARGIAREATDDFFGAVMDATKAIELDPTNIKFYAGRANSRRSYGDYAGAIADYNKVLEATPQETHALLMRAWTRLFAEDNEGAYEDAVRYIKMSGDNTGESIYTSFVAYIALRKSKGDAAAKSYIVRTLSKTSGDSWPISILKFFAGRLTDKQLLDLAKGEFEPTDAHSAIGVKAMLDGDRDLARIHFQWDHDHGSHKVIMHQLARTEFARL